jgi:hypothetical protein
MPQIPVLSERQAARTVTTQGVTPGSAIGFSMESSGLRRLGQGVSQAGGTAQDINADIEQKRYNAQRAAAINSAMGTFAQYSGELLREMETTAEPGAEGFTQAYIDGTSAKIDELSQTEDEATTAAIRNTLTNFQRGRVEQAMAFQANEQVAFERSKIIESSRILANEAAASPELLPMFQEQGRAAILDATDSLTPAEQRKLISDWDQQVTSAALTGQLRHDPQGVADRLEAGEFDDILDPSVKEGMITRATNKARADYEYSLRMQDRADRLADENRKDAQDANYVRLFTGALLQETDRDDVIEAMQNGDIDITQGKSVLTAVETGLEDVSDPQYELELRHQIHNGMADAVDVLDAVASGEVGSDSARSLLDLAHRINNSEKTDEEKQVEDAVKRERDNLVRRIKDGAGPFADLSGEIVQNQTFAEREFDQRTLAGEDPVIVADEIAKRYARKTKSVSANSPETAFGHFTGDIENPTQADFEAAVQSLAADTRLTDKEKEQAMRNLAAIQQRIRSSE